MSRDEIVVVKVFCHAETRKASLLSDDGQEGNAQWVAKSLSNGCNVPSRDEEGEVGIPRWLAEKYGWEHDG